MATATSGDGTVDEDVMKVLEGKAARQDALLEAVKARVEKYKKGGSGDEQATV